MGKVSESIWHNGQYTVPMAEISYLISSKNQDGSLQGGTIVFKHSKYNEETQCFEPNIWLDATAFISISQAWCYYRAELESETLANLEPASENACLQKDCPARIKSDIDTPGGFNVT
jgi:hypothetical protein